MKKTNQFSKNNISNSYNKNINYNNKFNNAGKNIVSNKASSNLSSKIAPYNKIELCNNNNYNTNLNNNNVNYVVEKKPECNYLASDYNRNINNSYINNNYSNKNISNFNSSNKLNNNINKYSQDSIVKIGNNNYNNNIINYDDIPIKSNYNNDFDSLIKDIGVFNIIDKNDKNFNNVTNIFSKVKDSNNKDTYHAYQVATRKSDNVDLSGNYLANKNNKNKLLSDNEEKQVKAVFLNCINQNKMSLGTKIMMDNERTHAFEAIKTKIYVNWTSVYSKPNVECFRIGSKSRCICSHDFPNHEKIITKKKFSVKCTLCNCKHFSFIPQLPEEVGEYWLPQRKGFKYVDWRAKCKCKHGWDSHDINKNLKCKECYNCSSFNSAFCCVVCNRFWQDHETVYELEDERKCNNKSYGEMYMPLQEAEEIRDAVYSNIDKSKPKMLGN